MARLYTAGSQAFRGMQPSPAGATGPHIVCVGLSEPVRPASRVSILWHALASAPSASCTPMPAVRLPCAPAGVTQITLPATGRRRWNRAGSAAGTPRRPGSSAWAWARRCRHSSRTVYAVQRGFVLHGQGDALAGVAGTHRFLAAGRSFTLFQASSNSTTARSARTVVRSRSRVRLAASNQAASLCNRSGVVRHRCWPGPAPGRRQSAGAAPRCRHRTTSAPAPPRRSCR